jgi:hypothetical protein
LQDNQWKEECEPSDPLKPLFNFASYYLSAAGKNWSSSDYWTKAYKTEETRRIGLEATLQDLKTKLQHAEAEYWKSAKRVEELQETFHATVTARTAELRAEAEKQKNKYGKTIHDQRVYYTKDNQKLQQIIDSIDDTHQATLKSQEKKHSDAVRRLKDQHAKDMDRQRLDHEAQVQEMTKAHEKQLVQARLDREQALVQQKKSHQQDVLDMERRVVSLESSLVDNSDDFRPATDDSLKFKYQQLKLAVETITYNLGAVAIPPNSQLDPGSFLEKEGKTETRFLLQSILWEHIKDGFFSSPFGLGALGTGDGKKKLLDLYVAYRSLFDTDPSTGKPLSTLQHLTPPSLTLPPPSRIFPHNPSFQHRPLPHLQRSQPLALRNLPIHPRRRPPQTRQRQQQHQIPTATTTRSSHRERPQVPLPREPRPRPHHSPRPAHPGKHRRHPGLHRRHRRTPRQHGGGIGAGAGRAARRAGAGNVGARGAGADWAVGVCGLL